MTKETMGTSSGGVAALDRSFAILEALASGDRALSLAEVARRTGLYKSTILRICGSLVSARMIERLPDGQYRIGPAALRYAASYQRTVAPMEILLPIMRQLADLSRESTAFYVRTEGVRTCLYRVESQHPVRYTVQEGSVLPLESGSGGRVLAAFSDWEGEPYATIRKNGFYVSIGERDAHTAGVSAPVFGRGKTLVGALTLAGPRPRVDEAFLDRFTGPLMEAAARATIAFGGRERAV